MIINYSCVAGTAVVTVPNSSGRCGGVASALGWTEITQGDVQIRNRICGEGLVRAGANESEREGIMSESEGTDLR